MTHLQAIDLDQTFDREGAIYMGARRNPNGCRVGLFGVPYDLSLIHI